MTGNFQNIVVCAVFFSLFAAGCAANQTRLKPYNRYVGAALTLKRPAALCDRKISNISMWQADVDIKPGTLYQLTEPDAPGESERCYEVYPLNEGTPIVIHKVYSWEGDGFWEARAVGNVYVEKLDRDVFFEYHWGNDYLQLAPWEDAGVEEKRYIGYDGMKYNQKRQRTLRPLPGIDAGLL